MVVKLPPAYTVEPLTAKAFTGPSAFGSHAVTAPDAASAAIRPRAAGVDPMTVKLPPVYTVAPSTARALTVPSALGFQAVTAPAGSRAAMWFRVAAVEPSE